VVPLLLPPPLLLLLLLLPRLLPLAPLQQQAVKYGAGHRLSFSFLMGKA